MSQAAVLEYLQADPGWHTSLELSQKLDVPRASVNRYIQRLRKWANIEIRWVRQGSNPYQEYRVGGRA